MIKTTNYYLKEIESSDIENIYRGLSDPEITKYYAVHFPTLEATQEQMTWYENLRKNGTGLWWGIYNHSDNTFLGAGGYNDLEIEHKKAEIGFWLLKEHWGKGIMKEVMPALFGYGFSSLGLNRIEGFVDADNEKCRSALKKINFSYEGTMRDFEYKDGKPTSVSIYAILKRDWGGDPELS